MDYNNNFLFPKRIFRMFLRNFKGTQKNLMRYSIIYVHGFKNIRMTGFFMRI